MPCNQRVILGVADAVHQQIHIQIGPAQAITPQWLNVEHRLNGCATEPRKLLVREEMLLPLCIFPAVTQMMDEAEADVLAYFSFPKPHRVKLHSTNALERLNKEVKRRADVVGIFPNEESIMRLLGAVLAEQNEEWLLQNRYLPQQSMTEINRVSDEVIEALPRSA